MMKKILATLTALTLAFAAPLTYAQCIIPAQTAIVKTTNYTALAGDTGKMFIMDCASACTLTLPPTPQSPNWFVGVASVGAGAVSVSPNGLLLNKSSSNITLSTDVGAHVWISTDNTNYFAGAGNPGASVVTAASNFVSGNLVQGAANNKTASDSGVVTANVVTATAAAGAAKQIATSAGANKALSYIDFPDFKYIPAASCINAVAASGWSTGATPAALCRAGTNNKDALLSPWGASDVGYFKVHLPNDWDSGASLDISLDLTSTSVTNAQTIIMQASTACGKGDGTTTDDVAFNAAQSFATITLNGNANRTWNATLTGLTKTGCAAGSTLWVKISRTTDTASNVGVYGATLDIPRLLTVQAN